MSEMVATEYTGLQDRVLARVKALPGETPRELASYLEAPYNSVTRALSRLIASNQIVNVEGRYIPLKTLDELIVETFGQPASDPRPQTMNWRRWWRRLGRLAGAPWLGIPAALYFVAAFVGYGAGAWFI